MSNHRPLILLDPRNDMKLGLDQAQEHTELPCLQGLSTPTSICIILAYAAHNDLEIFQFDTKLAF